MRNQLSCERRITNQFTQGISSLRPAGLIHRDRILLSRIGFPDFSDWNTRSSGPSDLQAYRAECMRALLTTTNADRFVRIARAFVKYAHRDSPGCLVRQNRKRD